MDDNQLDKYFKNHLEEYVDDGSPAAAWRGMQSMMGPPPNPGMKVFLVSRKIFWSMAAIILLLICSFLYGTWRHTIEVDKLHTSIEEMKEQLDGRGRTDTLLVLAGPDGALHKLSPAEFNKLREGEIKAGSSALVDQAPANTFSPKYPNPHNPTIVNPSTSLTFEKKSTLKDQSIVQNSSADQKPSTTLGGQQLEKQSPKQAEQAVPIQKQIAEETDTEAKKDKKEEENLSAVQKEESKVEKLLSDNEGQKEKNQVFEKPRKKSEFFKKLVKQLGFRTGLEASVASGGFEYGSLESASLSGGLGLELKIGDRFALRTGARFRNLAYEIGDLGAELISEDFLTRFPGIETLGTDASIHEIKMSGAYFELPLGLRYFYPVNRKIRAFAGVDVSGGGFLQQNFTYEVFQNNMEEYNRGKSTINPWNWGTGRLSLGASIAMSKKVEWESSVFFEKDLESRGTEEFSFYLVGLSTSLWLSQ